MKERIKEVIERKYGTVRRARHRLTLEKLEQAVLESFEYGSDYVAAGDTSAFQYAIGLLAEEGYVMPIFKKKKYKYSRLEEAYWLPETVTLLPGWSEADMMRVRDARGLNLDYYRNQPEEQTADLWEYIERVYYFLRTAEEPQEVLNYEVMARLAGA